MRLAAQVFYLARRSVIRTLRQPANWITPLIFPLALMAVNTGGSTRRRTSQLPQRLVPRVLPAFPFIQGALFATVNAASTSPRHPDEAF
jgi:hypothetical protein